MQTHIYNYRYNLCTRSITGRYRPIFGPMTTEEKRMGFFKFLPDFRSPGMVSFSFFKLVFSLLNRTFFSSTPLSFNLVLPPFLVSEIFITLFYYPCDYLSGSCLYTQFLINQISFSVFFSHSLYPYFPNQFLIYSSYIQMNGATFTFLYQMYFFLY